MSPYGVTRPQWIHSPFISKISSSIWIMKSVSPCIIHHHCSPYCHIYASVNWVSIGSGNGLSPVRHQAIAWTNADLLSIGPLGTRFSEIKIENVTFSFKKMHLKMLCVKWRPFCPGEMSLIWRKYTQLWAVTAVHDDGLAVLAPLTHWGWVSQIGIRKLTITGSGNGLSPGWQQAIIWTNVRILLFWTWRTNCSEILSEICTFSFEKLHLKMSSVKW